jgi:SsrA-binding protein
VSRPPDKSIKLVAKNKKAYFNYEVMEKVEAGLVLVGSEVKSLRAGKLQLVDAYGKIEGGEAWLIHAHIGDYDHAGAWAHDPTRKRKLLLHKNEIERLDSRVREKGYTLIPLEVYFKEGRAKVLLGVCKGKAVHDKRKSIKEKDLDREIARTLNQEDG